MQQHVVYLMAVLVLTGLVVSGASSHPAPVKESSNTSLACMICETIVVRAVFILLPEAILSVSILLCRREVLKVLFL